MKVVVYGAGYVGLVTGTGLAELGNHVTMVDIDAARVTALGRGEMPIFEPGLAELIERNRRQERLLFSTELPQTLATAEFYFIAVATPPSQDGTADTRAVFEVAKTIARTAKSWCR